MGIFCFLFHFKTNLLCTKMCKSEWVWILCKANCVIWFKIIFNSGIIYQTFKFYSTSSIFSEYFLSSLSIKTDAVLKDVPTLHLKLTWQEPHRLLHFSLAIWRMMEASICFTLLLCFDPLFLLEMHPGLFLWITWQQTHYFVSVFSLSAETSHRGSSGEA